MAFYSTLVEDLLSEVDVLLNNYVIDGYQALVSYLEVPLASAIVLFFVCYGVALTQGWVKGSLAELTKSLFRIGIIYFLGMNWGNFSDYIYTLFYDAAGHIGDVLVEASPIPIPTLGGDGINGALQSILIELMNISEWIIHRGSFTNWMPIIQGIAIGCAGVFLVGFAILEIIIAKCMLSILFVTAPLFIAFTLFGSTKSFFDRWLGSCAGYSLLMIFICSGLGLVVALDQWSLESMYANKALGATAIDICVVVLVTFVCFGILKRISILAMSIGGSVSAVSSDEMFASGVGSLVGGALGRLGVAGGLVKTLMKAFKGNGKSANGNKNSSGVNTKDAMKDLRQSEPASS